MTPFDGVKIRSSSKTDPAFIMELFFASLLILLVLVKLLKQTKTKSMAPNLPPGPRKLPVIGNIHNLATNPLPYRALRDLARKYGPLMHLKLGELSTVIVSTPEAAKEVMKTHDINFANRPLILAAVVISYNATNLMFAPYGDYWRNLRRICSSEVLSTKRVQSLRSVREEEVLKFVDSISQCAGLPINLSKMLLSLTYGITGRAVFGKKCRDQEAFISTVNEAVALSGGFDIADLYPSSKLLAYISGMKPKLENIHRSFDRILNNIIQEHKDRKVSEGEEDLVDVFLRVQEQGEVEFPLSLDSIKAVILDIFSAGSETSSRTVEWAMSEMLKNPSIMEKAQAEVRQVFGKTGRVDETGTQELEFLKLVIKETLRLHPPAPLILPRENKESCEIFGYDIPAKTKVIVNVWAIGRDPRYWKDPETFYPERFLNSSVDFKGLNFEFIPFGAGRRICPGMSFGLANVELPLACLLYYFDWKRADGTKNEDLDMIEVFGVTVGRKNDLELVPTTYHPL